MFQIKLKIKFKKTLKTNNHKNMKTKLITIILGILFFNNSNSQNQITQTQIKNDLAEYIYKDRINMPESFKNLDGIKKRLKIYGCYNYKIDESLKNGVYGFSTFDFHTRTYFFIVENDKYQILNLSTRQDLDKSIKEIFDFCERQNYCHEIALDYISNITRKFYMINKNPINRPETHCETSKKDKKKLP